MSDNVTRSIIVKASPAEVYAICSDFARFPDFMKYIKSVTVIDQKRSHWIMEGPMGQDLEWDAETTRMEPNKRIAWRSLEGSQIKTSGQVSFNALPDNETEITAMIHYELPGGSIGKTIAEFFYDPEKRLDEDLRNLKAVIEGRREKATASL
jgi:uncharacterized membrane protein